MIMESQPPLETFSNMGHQSTQNTLNLGKYTIRANEESSNLRVGSFWKRKNTSECSDRQGRSASPEESPLKKLAISPKDVLNQNQNSIISSTSSLSSATPSITTQSNEYVASHHNDASVLVNKFQALNERLTGNSSQSSFISVGGPPSLVRSPDTISDTQESRSMVMSTTDENTHESVTVNINPELFNNTSNESTTNQSGRLSSPASGLDSYPASKCSIKYPKQLRKKVYPKQRPYDKILSDVNFVLSGYENPRRSKIRDLALQMGAKYQPSWNRFCTHLICAFKNTPKYKEVMAENGRIVREHWIQECSRQRELLDWRNFKLGKYPYPDSEEEVDVDDLDYALKTSYGVERPQASQTQ